MTSDPFTIFDHFTILTTHDIRDWDKPSYRERWQANCNKCISMCCYIPMRGTQMDNIYKKDESIGKDLFTYNFVIIKPYDDKEEKKNGWKQFPDDEGKSLMICPLAIPEGCMIYDDRPLICERFKCLMKCGIKLSSL